jgi:tetratricopeptide (TPR) repeat protein
VGVALLLGGCTVTSFVGQQYTNFTAYYNRFYNANEAFEKGLRSIEQGDQPVDLTRYLPVFRAPSTSRSTQEFEKAIQKSAGVLREHPDSKWVDDALLLIGKSYFYQQNYVGAIQKFREVIALDGKRSQEARFWLARTLVTNQRYEEAQEEIRLGLQQSEEGTWTARLRLVRGQLLVRQEAWEEAAQALRQGLEGDVPDEVGARGSFLLGQVQETRGTPDAARAAYQQVLEYDSRYALNFAARLNDIELQGLHANTKQALARLHDLERDDKNYERRGEMAIVRARIYRSQGKYERAQRTLKNVLYGDEPPSGASEGRLHYDLARLYRDAYKDFSKAAAHFDTASTSLGGRGQGDEEDVQPLPAAPVDPGAQADRYRSLAQRAQDVARMDSLLRVGRMSESEFRAFVADLRRKQEAEREAEAEAEERRQSRSSLRLRRGGNNRQGQPREPSSPAADTRSSEAGFLFHNDPARVQQGRRQFERTWGDRPRVDNWRRRNAIRNAQTASSSEGDETGATASAGSADEEASPAERSAQEAESLDLSAIPRDSTSQAKMEAERAVARYELANALFLSAGRPDSAATWYRRILQENGDHPVAKRALYALAEAYRAQEDTTAAQQAYRRLVDRYPDTDLAARARRQLGRPDERPADDRTVRADEAYARAYEQWQKNRLDAALPQLLDVAVQYPETDAAPRSLLAAGIVYWQQVQRDSARAAHSLLRRHLRLLRRADTTRSEATDTTEVQSETDPSGSLPDSVAAGTDSTRVPRRADSTQSPLSASPDTLRATTRDGAGASSPTDSVRAVEDTTAVPDPRATADSTEEDKAAEEDVYAPLDTLLAHLTTRYSSAPQVNRARAILGLIEERRAPADTARADTTAQDSLIADTTGQVPPTPDTAAAADTAIADTADIPEWKRQMQEQREKLRKQREQRQQDSLVAEGDSTSVAPSERDSTRPSGSSRDARQVLPAPTGAIQNPQDSTSTSDIDRSKGGWTLLVQTFSRSQAASVQVSMLGRKVGDRWPVELMKQKIDGETQYRLIVGQFASEEEADEARDQLAQQISTAPEVWALPSQPQP